MDIRSGHLAHERDLSDGRRVRALLRGADGRDRQRAEAVRIAYQLPDGLHRDARHRARGRQEDDVRAGLDKGAHVLAGDDVLRALAQHACGVHLARGEDDSLAQLAPVQPERALDGRVLHAHAGVAGQQDHVNAHVAGAPGVFKRRDAPVRHRPHALALPGDLLVDGLQVDAHRPAGQRLELSHRVLRRALGQRADDGMLHVKEIEQQDVRAHGGGELCVGDIAQHRHERADGLARDGAALAPRDGREQLPAGHGRKVRRVTIKNPLHPHPPVRSARPPAAP